MKYTYENHKKALEYLKKNSPHDIEAFKKLHALEVEGTDKAKINFTEILLSMIWTVEEKIELISLYEYKCMLDMNTETARLNRDSAYGNYGIEGIIPIDLCIKNQNLSGLEALLTIGANISVSSVSYVTEMKDADLRLKAGELLIKYFGDKENIKAIGAYAWHAAAIPPNLCDSYYIDKHGEATSMKDIIGLGDIKLFKLFLPIVKNPNRLLKYAVAKGNIEIANLLIEHGADVNYQEQEYEVDRCGAAYKPVIKIAIDNNDLEMIKFLHERGATFDFVDKSERILKIANRRGNLNKLMQEYPKDLLAIQNNISLTKTSLEYAIKVGPASLLEVELINAPYITERANQRGEVQVNGRVAVVNYLYKNGATFGEGLINYTDLICFSVLAKDIDSARFYFEEAEKKGDKLNFNQIIQMVAKPSNKLLSNYAKPYIPEIINPIFELCKEFSEKIDKNNHQNNIKLMIELMFKEVSKNTHRFNKHYKEIITRFTSELNDEEIKTLAVIFDTPFADLDYVLSLGYDVKVLNKDGSNLIMDYIRKGANLDEILRLIDLGVDVNYQTPETGFSALSYAILSLPKWEHTSYFEYLRYTDVKEKYDAKRQKAIISKLIQLSNKSIINSKALERAVYNIIEPGYLQIIDNDVLEQLSKNGFKVTDEYFTNSIKFIEELHNYGAPIDKQVFLRNLYNNFNNKPIGTNLEFPNIEAAQNMTTEERKELFKLVRENIDRTYITSRKQMSDPDTKTGTYFDLYSQRWLDETKEREAQRILYDEILTYFGNLSGGQILNLIDRYPLFDVNMPFNDNCISGNLLTLALDLGDDNLFRGLLKRGATIICHDENGHDVTPKVFDKRYIDAFIKFTEEYNPNQELDDLIKAISEKPKTKVIEN